MGQHWCNQAIASPNPGYIAQVWCFICNCMKKTNSISRMKRYSNLHQHSTGISTRTTLKFFYWNTTPSTIWSLCLNEVKETFWCNQSYKPSNNHNLFAFERQETNLITTYLRPGNRSEILLVAPQFIGTLITISLSSQSRKFVARIDFS